MKYLNQTINLAEGWNMSKECDLTWSWIRVGTTFHAKICAIKGRKNMDLTEAENIKKRRQECTEEIYRKDLGDLDGHR